MHLLTDISAHGLGHLAQTAPVLDALAARVPTLRLTVRSALSRRQLERRISAGFEHVAEARDFGFAMYNAVDIDFAASAQRYRQFHANWPRRVAAESAWLRRHGVDAVLSNVAYLPLAGAAQAGISAAGLCSLNWADLFAHYFSSEPWAGEIHAQMLAAYNAATGFLRIAPGLPMSRLIRRHDVEPIARLGQRNRKNLARRLGLDPDQRWVLLAMGGMEFHLPVKEWPLTPGLSILLPEASMIERNDIRSFDLPGLEFGDLLASVDAVITKPGYGTFVEAACSGVPILYLERNDWPETPYLTAWLGTHARAGALTRERLLTGNFIDLLEGLWRAPPRPVPTAGGASAAADWLAAALRLT